MNKVAHGKQALALIISALLLGGCGGGGDATTNADTTSVDNSTGGSTDTGNDSGSDTGTGNDNDNSGNNAGNANSTDGVLCDYSNDTYNDSDSVMTFSTAQWSCDGNNRALTANGIPDHATGAFPNAGNPNIITEQNVSASMTLSPEEAATATELGGPRGYVGYVLNGVKIDASTAGTCDDFGSSCSLIGNAGSWNIEALGQSHFDFGTDDNNAHVQPTGEYHYHGMPEGFITLRGGNSSTMTLIGWASDGFPIYARYGYSVADDADSGLKVVNGSYQLVSAVSETRPDVNVYEMGTFAQD